AEHLVINEFVGLGGLNHPVQGQYAPHAGVLENDPMLVLGASFVQNPVDRETLAVSLVESFLIVAHGYPPVMDGVAAGLFLLCRRTYKESRAFYFGPISGETWAAPSAPTRLWSLHE